MKKVLAILLICLCGGGIFLGIHTPTGDPAVSLRTVSIQRGDLLATVNATGTLQPEEVVNVGAQVAGLIIKFGEDPNTPTKHVDYCSIVEQDAILARIDPTVYEAALQEAEAMLESSMANLKQQTAKLQQAKNNWERAQVLFASKTISEEEYDVAQADYAVAESNVDVGRAAIRQHEARLNTARINLGYCTIKSPVRGTVIERRVNIGQTVVASLNAPSLFLIAKDLTKMEVWTSVNEADIGKIKMDMPVKFTVDTHEEEAFHGAVTQIRMNAQMTQNVVTYTVVITTDNSDGKLLPYLTANVHFEIEHRPQVLLVPNVALRWLPDASQLDSSVNRTILDEQVDKKGSKGRIWVTESEHRVKPIEVVVGASDGSVTEISSDCPLEGLSVVIGEDFTRDDEEEASNPFMPNISRKQSSR